MKKIVLMMMLLFASTNVLAEWTKVNQIDDLTYYADIQSIRKNGNKVKMWILYDLKPVQQKSFLSAIMYYEYDCFESTERMLDFYQYSKNMIKGDMVFSSTNISEQPRALVPGSVDNRLSKVACGGK